ncbi:restriction endonuclease [Jeotgalibaca caeni]|uniref:restriction endonuclease n=1 Tax=Jeotgalibaca caeni TaxID=3028623 RepID=UPI00237ED659|nr:restriction endonuclease [Jeotgalibaca caeni]MDE1549840.1 restriction endonuclease [Jeotgalibaca caeni]
MRGTVVSNLADFSSELDKMVNNDQYSFSSTFLDLEQQEMTDQKKRLLTKIINGKTGIKTGGIGLEEIVMELMQIEGYEATISLKNRFKGIADIDVEATKSDKFFGVQKVIIQIKHHSGFSDSYGLQQLVAAKKELDKNEYKLIFITTAKVNNNVQEEAENLEITLIDGSELVDWIFENIEELSDASKQKLSISVIPHIL